MLEPTPMFFGSGETKVWSGRQHVSILMEAEKLRYGVETICSHLAQGCIFFTAKKIMPRGWITFCLMSDNKKLPILDCETTSGSLPHPVYQMRQYLPHCFTSRIVWNDLRLTSSSRVSNEAISPSLPHLKDSVKLPPAHFLIPSIKWGNISLTASRIYWGNICLTASPRGSSDAISASLPHLEDQVRQYFPYLILIGSSKR